PASLGILVIDVASAKIVHAYRGGSFELALVAPGKPSELVFRDTAYLDVGRSTRAGTLDLANGCLDASAWMPPDTVIGLEATGFVVVHRIDEHVAGSGFDSLERWDLARRPTAIRHMAF